MAYQYAKMGLAALMAAAPAMAAPLPQQVTVVCVDQTGKTITCPESAQVQAQSWHQPTSAQPSVAQTSAAKSSTKAAASSASSPSTTAAPSNPSGGTSTSGGKKGLAITKNSGAFAAASSIAASANGAIAWYYDWEGYPLSQISGAEFVPQLHTKDDMFVSAWKSQNPAPQGKGAKHALFLNEPDNSQFGCDAKTAADLYTSTYAPGAAGALLGGPAVTSGPSGPAWLKQFLGYCSSCKIDFMPMHVYVDSNDLSLLQTAVTNIRNTIPKGMDIWVTEFGLKAQRDGGNFSADERADFIAKASSWMDNQPDIKRYSPYQVSTDSSSDSMTPGGSIVQKYVSA